MHGDMTNQFAGPGSIGGMMSSISGKSQLVEALWPADKAGGCLGIVAIIVALSASAIGILAALPSLTLKGEGT